MRIDWERFFYSREKGEKVMDHKKRVKKAAIDKGIPIPKIERPGNIGGYKYPWLDLEVGDSFFISKEDCKCPSGSVTTARKRYAPRNFTTRMVEGGWRVWRIK